MAPPANKDATFSYNSTATPENKAYPFIAYNPKMGTSHGERRRKLKEKYNEKIKKLHGWSWQFTFVGLFVLVCDLLASAMLSQSSIPTMMFWAWVYHGTLVHTIVLINHEASHDLIAPTQFLNKLLSIIIQLPLFVPQAQTFRRLHIIHHVHIGVFGADTDLPTRFEARMFKNPFTKFLWLLFQPLTYSLRPLLTLKNKVTGWETINTIVQFGFNFIWAHFFGWRILFFYHLFGTLIGLSLHPVAGHFISEHYVFDTPQDTYSYYGYWGNVIGVGVGYHNEHHDFSGIPGHKLHHLKEIAPEFYNNLKSYNSWTKVMIDWIFQKPVNPSRRVIRAFTDENGVQHKVY